MMRGTITDRRDIASMSNIRMMPATAKRSARGTRATDKALVQRINEMQDLLIEIRGVLDIQLRLINKLRMDVDVLNEQQRELTSRELYLRQPAAGAATVSPARSTAQDRQSGKAVRSSRSQFG